MKLQPIEVLNEIEGNGRDQNWRDLVGKWMREELDNQHKCPSIVALYVHGNEAMRVHIQDTSNPQVKKIACVESLSPFQQKWIVQKNYEGSKEGVKAAMLDAMTWYPVPPVTQAQIDEVVSAIEQVPCRDTFNHATVNDPCIDFSGKVVSENGKDSSGYRLSIQMGSDLDLCMTAPYITYSMQWHDRDEGWTGEEIPDEHIDQVHKALHEKVNEIRARGVFITAVISDHADQKYGYGMSLDGPNFHPVLENQGLDDDLADPDANDNYQPMRM